MAKTRSAIEAEVKYILGNRTDLDTDLSMFVRRAYQSITQLYEFPEGQATASINMIAGTRGPYNLPADFFSIYSLRNDTEEERMIQISPQEYDSLDQEVNNPPDRYMLFAEQLWVYPTPSSADLLMLRYRKMFADLDQSSSVHTLPDSWEAPLVWLSAAFAFDMTNEIERARYYRGAVGQHLRSQQQRLAANLFDRDEAMQVIGGEIK